MSKREALQALGDKIQIPPPPDIVVRVNAMLDDADVGLEEVAQLAATNSAVSARVVRLSNTSYYGLSAPVSSVEQAVTVVGARALRNVTLQVAILERYERLGSVPDFDFDDLWLHSTTTAQLAQALAEACYRRTGLAPDDFYASGLLHDIGTAVLLESLGEQYSECLRHVRRTGSTLHEAEHHLLGFTHIEVGALFATRWQLPEKVAHAIAYHHGPKEVIVSHADVAVLAIADQLAYRVESGTFEDARACLAVLAEKTLGIRRDEFERVVERARVVRPEMAA